MAGILRAMLRRLTTLAGLCWVLLVLGACPQQRRTPTPDASGGSEPVGPRGADVEPEHRGDEASTVSDRRTGVQFTLPAGWTARSGPGDAVATAWEPAESALRVQLRRWDGESSTVQRIMATDPWSWSAPGPYASIAVADGEPVVAAWREVDPRSSADEWIVFGWFLTVDGEGLGLIARIPATRLEEGWITANSILATAATEGGA